MIRLFNGSSVSDGEVQYCLGSTWTPVCGDDWDESEAAVACKHLGFAGEGMKCRITFSHEVKEILRDNFTQKKAIPSFFLQELMCLVKR